MAKKLGTYIQQIWTDDTGGGMKVDYLELINGVVLGVTDESVVAFENAEEVGEEEFASMIIIAQEVNANLTAKQIKKEFDKQVKKSFDLTESLEGFLNDKMIEQGKDSLNQKHLNDVKKVNELLQKVTHLLDR